MFNVLFEHDFYRLFLIGNSKLAIKNSNLLLLFLSNYLCNFLIANKIEKIYLQKFK